MSGHKQTESRVLLVAAVVVTVITIPVATLLQVIFAPKTAKDVLAVVAAFVSWPYAFVVAISLIAIVFRHSVERLLDRLVSWDTPAGKIAFTEQATPSEDVAPAQRAEDDRATISDKMLHIPEEKFFNAIDYMMQYVDRARQWRFHYLSYFLVPQSKLILQWFVKSGPHDVPLYHGEWNRAVPAPEQRIAIVQALTTYRLIEYDRDGRIAATEDGADFIAFVEANKAWTSGVPAPADLMEPPEIRADAAEGGDA